MTPEPRPSGPSGHVCWTYQDLATFEARARKFLLAGLVAGERAHYATGEPTQAVVDRWNADPRLREALRSGAARVVSVRDRYRDGGVDPEGQVAVYRALTEAALADGHRGLRVAADATTLVGTPAQREAFARYEHLVDRFMRDRPMSAACGYDRTRLDDRAIEELACLHPASDPDATLFHLHAADPADADLVLTGELDTSNQDLFAAALRHADISRPDGELVVRADELRFIDYRSLLHLHRHAERRGTAVVLRTGLAPAARLVQLLGLSRVRVEVPR